MPAFFDASIFHPISQSENGKLSHNVKPCLRYNLPGIWFYCMITQHGATTFYRIIFCNHNNGVLKPSAVEHTILHNSSTAVKACNFKAADWEGCWKPHLLNEESFVYYCRLMQENVPHHENYAYSISLIAM